MFTKDLWIDIVKSFLSTLLMGMGITLFVSCELGSDPISVFLDGVHRTTGLGIAVIDQILNGIIFLIGLIINRKVIGVNTVINVLVLGICIQLPHMLIEPMNLANQALWIRILAMVVAQILLATSFAWLQTFKNGISCMDAILFFVQEKTHLKYRTIRILYDAIFIIVGYTFGGIIGVGTIFSLVTNGYFTEKIRIKIDMSHERKKERRVKNERKYSASSNVYHS